MQFFVLSEYAGDAFVSKLKNIGEVILLPQNRFLNSAEGCHADMQMFKTGEKSVLVSDGISDNVVGKLRKFGISVAYGASTVSSLYPENIKYNVLPAGDSIFHNFKYTAPEVIAYAREKNLNCIDVKQGYCACTSMYFSFCNLILTGDNGIISAALKNNYNVCVFENNSEIELAGYNHGFIGGSGLVLDNGKRVMFNGAFSKLYPDVAKVLTKYGIEIIDGAPGCLRDIGGVVSFTF